MCLLGTCKIGPPRRSLVLNGVLVLPIPEGGGKLVNYIDTLTFSSSLGLCGVDGAFLIKMSEFLLDEGGC